MDLHTQANISKIERLQYPPTDSPSHLLSDNSIQTPEICLCNLQINLFFFLLNRKLSIDHPHIYLSLQPHKLGTFIVTWHIPFLYIFSHIVHFVTNNKQTETETHLGHLLPELIRLCTLFSLVSGRVEFF